jgi:hypothetical protein
VNDEGVRFVIGIGENIPELDEQLAARGTSDWAFLTAYNPYSHGLSDKENRVRQESLFDYLEKAGYEFLLGYGESRHRGWPAEPSFLILGVSRDKAIDLAMEFQQNAIVAGSLGGPAELIWCQ